MAMSFFLGVQIVALLSNSYPFGNAFEGEAIMINMSLADLWIHPLAKTKGNIWHLEFPSHKIFHPTYQWPAQKYC